MPAFGVLVAVLLAPGALGFLALGVRGLTGNRPLVFPSGRLLGLVAFCFLPGLAAPLSFWYRDSMSHPAVHPAGSPFSSWLFLPLLIYPAVLALIYRSLRGYTILGAGEEALAAALRRALGHLGLLFEESLNRLHLPSRRVDLRLVFQPGFGIARLVMEPENHALLDDISQALRDAFDAAPGPPQRTGSAIFFGVGLLLAGVAIALAASIR